MEDEEILLTNLCTDLVSLKRFEDFPLHLLANKRPGEWVDANDFCLRMGISANDRKPGLFATWLPDPSAIDGYVVFLFYDEKSKWSMAAHYNRQRLVERNGHEPSAKAPALTAAPSPPPLP